MRTRKTPCLDTSRIGTFPVQIFIVLSLASFYCDKNNRTDKNFLITKIGEQVSKKIGYLAMTFC